MNSWALALLAILASSILKSRAVNASTPPAVQSTPVCRLQGSVGAAGGGGGGGGLFADDEDTDEDEGSEDTRDRDRGVSPQDAEEDGQGGGLLGFGGSQEGSSFPVPSEVDMTDGLPEGGVVGLV